MLDAVFRDHMVLQAMQPTRVFGTGDTAVTVEVDGVRAQSERTADGWLCELPAHPYGGPYTMTVTDGAQTVQLHDVWYGDVLLLAGQSNLQIKLFETNTPPYFYRDNPLVRLFTPARPEAGEFFSPQDGWLTATADTVGKWPAVGFLAGDLLSRRTGHAVGLIVCYQGASMIQSFLPPGILDDTPFAFASEKESGSTRIEAYMLWNHDGFLYDYMFRKVAPFACGAVIWYQGESNADQPGNTKEGYAAMLHLLIESWRNDLRQPTLPFLVVRMPDLIGVGDPDGWRAIQAAQGEAGVVNAFTQSIESADISENNDIHPPTKLPLAVRIADALAKVFMP